MKYDIVPPPKAPKWKDNEERYERRFPGCPHKTCTV